MKFEFDIEVPEVDVFITEVKVVCGETEVVLHKVKNGNKEGLTGGQTGDWLPSWDWRGPYQDDPEDRFGYALPYEKMVDVAVKRAKAIETHRLIGIAADDIARKL